MRTKHGWLLAGTVLAIVGAGTVWLLASGDRAAVVAAVLTLSVAVLALFVQLFGVPWQKNSVDEEGLAACGRALAREVRKRESAAQNKFLADSGAGRPANVGFAPTEQVSWSHELVMWRSDGGGESGSLADIADFYHGSDLYPGLCHGRLVVLGKAGAGKTVLANELLLDLVGELLDRGIRPGDGWRVPVRLSLPAFDPVEMDEHADSQLVAARLDDWIARHLTEVYGLLPSAAAALVEQGRILPVLDGLDEMDPDHGQIPRAAAVARALNCPAGGGLRRVVVTCRTGRYKHLAGIAALPGQQAVLQDATAVELEPLPPAEVAAYLIRRFPDPADHTRVQQRWQPVLEHLDSQPDGPLAGALGSPLRLFMAVTAYHQGDAEPAELVGPPGDRLDGFLFERFVPAVTLQNTGPGHVYSSQDVTRWLATLARHLETRQRLYGGSGSDLDLHMLWTAAGYRTPRYLAAALRGVLMAIPLLIVAGLYVRGTGHLLAPDLGGRIATAWGVAVVATAAWRASRAPVKVHTLALSRLRFQTGQGQLRRWPVLALGAAMAGGFVIVLFSAGGFAGKLWLAGLGVLIWWIVESLDQAPSGMDRPSRLVTQGWTYDIVITLGLGLGFGLLLGLQNRVSDGLTFGFAAGLATGLALGGLMDSNSPWLRYFIATQILAWRHQLPIRPALFMDWAYTAGLLRLSGISTQFRHRELQYMLLRGHDQEELNTRVKFARIDLKVTEAEQYHENALTKQAARAHFDRGLKLERLGRAEEALAAYDAAIRLDPKDANAHNGRGNALRILGRPEEALAAHDEAIRLEPKDAAARFNRGNELGDLGRPEEALAAYDEAIRLDPKLAAARFNRGNVLGDLGRPEEALAAYDEAIRLEPKDAAAHRGRGNVLQDLDRAEEALASYDRALGLAPDDPSCHFDKGAMLFDLGRFDEAAPEFREVTRLRPDDVLGARALLGVISWSIDQEEARAHFAAALSSPGTLLTPFTRGLYRAVSLAGLGRTDDAQRELEAALHAPSADEAARDDATRLLQRLQNPALPMLNTLLHLLELAVADEITSTP